jgi:glycosyltransferase involved in cell wall biosynthesis
MCVVSMHNGLSHQNIPLENFLRLSPEEFSQHVIALDQSQEEAEEFVRAAYPNSQAVVRGVDWRRRPVGGARELLSLLTACKPDIVHLNHIASGLLAGSLARMLTDARVVVTLHGEYRRYSLWQRLGLLLAMMLSHVVVCNSRSTYRSLGRLRTTFLRGKRIRVCYNGVNRERIDAATRAPSSLRGHVADRTFCVGFVGRLVAVKDIPTLLRGFAEFHAQRAKSRLVIVGDGPLRRRLEDLAKELGVAEAVTFHGEASREDVYRILAGLDAAVISSKSEGFCNAMVEAMFAGKAVVASDLPVLREVLGVGCGRFFHVGSSRSLAEQLTALYDDELLRRSLGEAAKERARQRYTLDACAERYARCYRRLVPQENESGRNP